MVNLVKNILESSENIKTHDKKKVIVMLDIIDGNIKRLEKTEAPHKAEVVTIITSFPVGVLKYLADGNNFATASQLSTFAQVEAVYELAKENKIDEDCRADLMTAILQAYEMLINIDVRVK